MGFTVNNRINGKVNVTPIIRSMTAADVFPLLEDLSDINHEEIAALTRMSPLLAISSMASHSESYVIDDGFGNIAGAFGIMAEKNVGDVASLWMITTNAIKPIAMQFLKGSKKWIDSFNERFAILYCHVYEKNAFTKRWLKIMGFEPSSHTNQWGLNGELFEEYFKVK